jgi:hypothetical protein
MRGGIRRCGRRHERLPLRQGRGPALLRQRPAWVREQEYFEEDCGEVSEA